ncbi:6-pyruvoyl trahydropterin synthase family protein [Streptomyces sp. NPDC091279]|uniref:6-pyruvoyl trahydropterin synthase family protein n=1 Tax=unclassified Streptomyces TaxID=2593676 RepID=UPI00382D58AE
MGFRISKEFHFSASHRLDGLSAEHPCGRLHGHNYIVVLELETRDGTLDAVGFVRDYGELGDFRKWLDTEVDHRHLNEVMSGLNPTAEHMARWLFEQWAPRYPELSGVRVSETPKTWAEYRP